VGGADAKPARVGEPPLDGNLELLRRERGDRKEVEQEQEQPQA
jgi:hypothetical protein